jgi:hypothetical protein
MKITKSSMVPRVAQWFPVLKGRCLKLAAAHSVYFGAIDVGQDALVAPTYMA